MNNLFPRLNYKLPKMKIVLLAAISLLSLQCKTTSTSTNGSSTASASHIPSDIPDHIILNPTTEPNTSIAITWRTSTVVKETRIQYLVATHGPFPAEAIQEMSAATTTLNRTSTPANYHSAILSGLIPGEKYIYRVGNEDAWSEWIQFQLPKASDPFQFIYFGDAQNDIKSMWSRVIREAYSQLPKADFMLHAGDLVNRFDSDEEWDEWFDAGSFIHSMIPGIMTPGNHEYRAEKLSPQWKVQFTLPDNGPDDHKETCYYFDYGNMRIISLNSMRAVRDKESLIQQAQWLKKVLATNDKKWIAITLHHPLYSTKAGRDNEDLRTYFQPLFDEYDVDLVLQGHDHAYGRGHNVPVGASAALGKSQTVYVVSVSGPKMYGMQPMDWMERKAKNTQLFQLISVDENKIRYEAYTARGELYDAFEIIKEDGEKKIVNDIPSVPEILE